MGGATRIPSPAAQAVAEAVRELGLERSYALAVQEMLDEDDADWPACCGSSCDPCVLTLAQAARRARVLLRARAAPVEPTTAEPTHGESGPTELAHPDRAQEGR